MFARVLDDAVVDVGEVHDMHHVREAALEPAAQHVLEDVGAKVAEVRALPHGRSARVQPDLLVAQWLDRLQPPRHRIVQT